MGVRREAKRLHRAILSFSKVVICLQLLCLAPPIGALPKNCNWLHNTLVKILDPQKITESGKPHLSFGNVNVKQIRRRWTHGYPQFAKLPNGVEIPPDNRLGGYHGTSKVAPQDALKFGLPQRGENINIQRHAEGGKDSAFRGVTRVISDPTTNNGAAYWADVGGYVYEIVGVPTWDVNKPLQGRIPTPGGFRDHLMVAENEFIIPAYIKPKYIKRWGVVDRDVNGRLRVNEWQLNPIFNQLTL